MNGVSGKRAVFSVVAASSNGIELPRALLMAALDATSRLRIIKIAMFKIVPWTVNGIRGELGVHAPERAAVARGRDIEVPYLTPNWTEACHVLNQGRRRSMFATPLHALSIVHMERGVSGKAVPRLVALVKSVDIGKPMVQCMMVIDVMEIRTLRNNATRFRVRLIANTRCGADGAFVQGRVVAATVFVRDSLRSKHRTVGFIALALLQRWLSVTLRNVRVTVNGVNGTILDHARRHAAGEQHILIEARLHWRWLVASNASGRAHRSSHATWKPVQWIATMMTGSRGLSARPLVVVVLA